jgi:hypothetical protein
MNAPATQAAVARAKVPLIIAGAAMVSALLTGGDPETFREALGGCWDHLEPTLPLILED